MSKLNYLEKLLEGIEVEWFPLGKVAKKIYSGGTPDTKKTEYWEHGTIPWMSSGEVNLKTIKETETFITEDGLNNSSAKFVPENSIVMALAGQGKTRGKVARTRIKLTTNQSLAAITFDERKINSDYIFHFLETQYDNLRQISSGNSGRGGLNLQMISAYKAPIPCPGDPEKSLAIQSEIVRILDKFTELTAELTAELTLRKKQYNYYRDQLLSFKEGEVEWKTLGEVAVIGTGNHDTQDAIEHGKYIFYARGREPLKLNVFDFDETAIITAGDGAGVGKVFHYAKGKYALHQRAYRIVPNAFMNPRFVYHYITAYFFTYIQKASVSSSVTSLRRPMFLKFPIPVPPSEEQARIVEILDKFDTLTNSITEGLPREIELRQKQYEYYRDLLFSFPKPETVSN
ncbi:TPA_asm: restriction endonuclease subunit S [Salmonella enterica subsp. enterica serovar Mbandaka]|nr:restriction endonuclease subunit S [Salmonella enterica subsp. enterica serovar Mbandaka]